MTSAQAGAGAVWSIVTLSSPSDDWDTFVASQEEASVYLRSGWTLVAGRVFGHRMYFIEARDSDNRLCAVLPLIQQRHWLFGNSLTSLAFYNYGGVVSTDDALALDVMAHARELAKNLGCSYLELRDLTHRDGGWNTRTDKVTMVRALPPTTAELSQQLGSKLRSQIKRADRERACVRVGGANLVEDFYRVFAANMHELGTPVYPISFFRALLERFPDLCSIVVVDHNDTPAAAGLLVIHGGKAEIPWASCSRDAKPLGFNMKLYWELMAYAIGRGCSQFDFGRSSVGAGTYKFKLQWGAKPVQLHWHRWERRSVVESSQTQEQGGLRAKASELWRRLPLRLANVIGPIISPHLPW